RDFANVGNILEQVNEPNLSDKPGDTYEQEMTIRQIFTHRKTLDSRRFSKECDGLAGGRRGPGRGLHRRLQLLWPRRPPKAAHKLLARNPSVRVAAGNPRQGPARTHNGIE